MKNERYKKKDLSGPVVERWEVEWDHGKAVYGSYPYHRTFAAALREAQKTGNKKDGYGFRLETVTIKRVMVGK